MSRSVKKYFKYEVEVERKTAEKWGYKLDNNKYVQELNPSAHIAKEVSLNLSIEPLRTEEQRIPKTDKYLQIVKEIENEQFKRSLLRKKREREKVVVKPCLNAHQPQFQLKRTMREISTILKTKKARDNQQEEHPSQNGGQEFDYQAAIAQITDEYNYLIEHKHINHKGSQTTQTMFKPKPKSHSEKLIEQIKKTSQLLQSSGIGHLAQKFHMNQTMSSLYRSYKDTMLKPQTQNHTHIIVPRKLKEEARKTDSPFRKSKIAQSVGLKIDLSRPASKCFSTFDPSHETLTVAEWVQKMKELEKDTAHNQQILMAYNTKIQQHKQKLDIPRADIINQKSEQAGKKRRSTTLHDWQAQAQSFGSQRRRAKEQYLSTLLAKKNRKFRKPWGNRIMIKYDSQSEAKKLLEGSFSQGGCPETQTQANIPKILKDRSLKKLDQQLHGQDSWVIQSIKQCKKDELHYERVCKNEKVNLFLKNSRKHK